MPPHHPVCQARGVAARTALGLHPRDGRPVACWVVHPADDAPAARAPVTRLAAALGLGTPADARLTEVDGHRASLTAAGGWATLWVGDGDELVAEHDDDWRDALLDRGWAVVVVGYAPELGDGRTSTVWEYLTGGADAHVGVVRAA